MNTKRALLWIVCISMVVWTLPTAAAHLTSPSDTSAGFGGNGVNDDPCRWTDNGTEHDEAPEQGKVPANCNVGNGDDKHDGVSGVYISEPDTFFLGVGACADHPVDAAIPGGDKKGFGDVGCDASQLFPQNVPEPLFWDFDGDDCYNTINQDANGVPFLTQQERKEDNKDCSEKKEMGLDAISLDPTLFPLGFVSAGAALCDLEVADATGVADEGVIDNSKKTGSTPDGTWDDGGFGGACHTEEGFYNDPEWNSPGCAGIDDDAPTKAGVISDNKVAHAEDWVSGDSVWISATCNFIGETGGTSKLLATALALVNNHLGSNAVDPVGGLENDSVTVTEFAHDVDDQGAKCFYDDPPKGGASADGAGLLEGDIVVNNGQFVLPAPNDGDGDPNGPYSPAIGDAVPPADQNPLVNCALETFTGETGGMECDQDAIADVANYGHGGGHDTYPNTASNLRFTKGEFHLNHLMDEHGAGKGHAPATGPSPFGGDSVFEEVDPGVAYPDAPTACQEELDVPPTAIVFVYDTAAFTDGVWYEAGEQVVNPGSSVNLHPTGVIPASAGWIDSTGGLDGTWNFGEPGDDHHHCDEDGHYEGGVEDQADGNPDDHENGSCNETGEDAGDEPHATSGVNTK